MVIRLVDKYIECLKCIPEAQRPTYMLSLSSREVLHISDISSIPLFFRIMPNLQHIASSFHICDRSTLPFTRTCSFPHWYSRRWSLRSAHLQLKHSTLLLFSRDRRVDADCSSISSIHNVKYVLSTQNLFGLYYNFTATPQTIAIFQPHAHLR